jgi:hypothetical protein
LFLGLLLLVRVDGSPQLFSNFTRIHSE